MLELCEIKLVLVGNTNVGKTSIVKTAITGSFTGDATSTLGASYSTKSFQINSRNIRLQIWDTAGQEKYRGMTPMYYHNAQVALVVYSVADRETFDAVDGWIKSLKDNADSNIITFVIGNKTDLSDQRQISSDEGNEKATRAGAEFAEVSAKTGFGIRDLFGLIPQLWLEQQAAHPMPDPRKQTVIVDANSKGESKSCC
jgi:small GTP-binding protein